MNVKHGKIFPGKKSGEYIGISGTKGNTSRPLICFGLTILHYYEFYPHLTFPVFVSDTEKKIIFFNDGDLNLYLLVRFKCVIRNALMIYIMSRKSKEKKYLFYSKILVFGEFYS